MVTEERTREVRSVVDMVTGWSAEREDVRGVVVVGSWARDAARMDSDASERGYDWSRTARVMLAVVPTLAP